MATFRVTFWRIGVAPSSYVVEAANGEDAFEVAQSEHCGDDWWSGDVKIEHLDGVIHPRPPQPPAPKPPLDPAVVIAVVIATSPIWLIAIFIFGLAVCG